MKKSFIKYTWVDELSIVNAKQLNRVENGIDELYENQSDIEEEIDNLKLSISETISTEVETATSQLKTSVQKLEEDFDNLETSFSELENSVETQITVEKNRAESAEIELELSFQNSILEINKNLSENYLLKSELEPFKTEIKGLIPGEAKKEIQKIYIDDSSEDIILKYANGDITLGRIIVGNGLEFDGEVLEVSSEATKVEGNPEGTAVEDLRKVLIKDKIYNVLERNIDTISKKSTSGLVDTYEITFTDGSPSVTFTVTNGTVGKDGAQGPQGEKGDTGEKGEKGDQGPQGEKGDTGAQGQDGVSGEDGLTPYINSSGNWQIGETDTGVKAEGTPGQNGEDGKTPYIGANGNWWIGTTDMGIKPTGTPGEPGQDGLTPYINSSGNWQIGETDTGVKAKGQDGTNGTNGSDGKTPYIGANGNWWIGNKDTGVKAQGTPGQNGEPGQDGEDGEDGLTPTIGANGNWWIGTTDTGVKAQGQDGVSPTLVIGSNGNWYINGVDSKVPSNTTDLNEKMDAIEEKVNQFMTLEAIDIDNETGVITMNVNFEPTSTTSE